MRRKFILTLWILLISGLLLTSLAFIGIERGWIGYMPDMEQIQSPINKFASQAFTSDGVLLGTWSRKENRIFVDQDSISPYLIKALVATEDERFYEHSGVDAKALGRAVIKRGIMGRHNAGGGSTITQQLAKQLYSATAKTTIERLLQKPIEWVIAVEIERYYTKEEIITLYLNYFDFLHNAVGIKTAANVYFGKSAYNLSINEAATLIGMCKNPSYFNPVRDLERCRLRRNVVLGQMVKAGYLSADSCAQLSAEPITLNFHRIDHKEGKAAYLREYLRQILMADKPKRENYREWQLQQFYTDSLSWETDPLYGWCKKNKKRDGSNYDIYTDGLKVYTTIDSRMQSYAESSVFNHVAFGLQPEFNKKRSSFPNFPYSNNLSANQIKQIFNRAMRQSDRYRMMKQAGASEDEIESAFKTKIPMTVYSYHGDVDTVMSPMDSIRYYKSFLRSGLVSIDPHNGYVKAYVGGLRYSQFQYDMVSDGRRQTGSIIKPYLYSLAMIDGSSPCDQVLHVQRTYRLDNGQTWTPRNTNHRRVGEMVSIQWGLQNSDNWVTAELMSRTSPITFKRLLESYGLRGPIEATMAMSLGTPEATVGEMVSGYTTFVNDGVRVDPILVTQIEDMHGNIVATFTPKMTEVLTADAAHKMLYMLQNVINGGTGGRLRSSFGLQIPLGGKTGTTQNNSDAWFMGFTPDLVAGCWVGGEERSVRFNTMTFGQGAAAALPIFGKFIKKVYSDHNLGYLGNIPFQLPEGFSPCGDAGSSDEAVEIYEGNSPDSTSSFSPF